MEKLPFNRNQNSIRSSQDTGGGEGEPSMPGEQFDDSSGMAGDDVQDSQVLDSSSATDQGDSSSSGDDSAGGQDMVSASSDTSSSESGGGSLEGESGGFGENSF